jgi:hypothetical protein
MDRRSGNHPEADRLSRSALQRLASSFLPSSGKLNLAFSLGGDAAAGRWTEPPASNRAQNAAISCPGTAASYRPEGDSYALVEGKKEEDVKLATCTFEWYCRFGRK